LRRLYQPNRRGTDDPELAGEKLHAKTYHFQPVRGRHSQAKVECVLRNLAVEDRVVQTAMKLVLRTHLRLTSTAPMDIGPSGMPRWLLLLSRQTCTTEPGAWWRLTFQELLHDYHTIMLTLIRERVVDGSMLHIIRQSLMVRWNTKGKWSRRRWGPAKVTISPLTATST